MQALCHPFVEAELEGSLAAYSPDDHNHDYDYDYDHHDHDHDNHESDDDQPLG